MRDLRKVRPMKTKKRACREHSNLSKKTRKNGQQKPQVDFISRGIHGFGYIARR